MKKFLLFFALVPVACSAVEYACTYYWDEEGFKRYNCDPEKLTANFIAYHETHKPPLTIEIPDYSPDSSTFTLIIRSENIRMTCRKFGSTATCE